ncbi:hypothetical protein Q7C36_005359 [Tachysurus vachellii]|uniref:DUF4587 domain-containing protein n=1 Tax=Tachysurus vachellii TaxID=175792 RepID=A0AA88SZ55_TACVA|nr:hypothetical protein Q7C36_005359 [Tachysurus vachellii]
MADPIVDQMTRLKLKLLEKRLENERAGHDERPDSAFSTRSYDGRNEALHSALRRKRDLLRRLREQHILDELARPQTWAGTRRHHPNESPASPSPPVYIYQSPPAAPPPAPPPPAPPPAPQPPRIIQHTVPHPPATIIQQLPQHQPLIAQIPPVQPAPYRSGSIKEDMVELMLMQNAQMHQIIMHNMMLKALPPMAAGTNGSPPASQGNYMKAKGAVHHHHHYGPPPLPPIGYSAWPSMMSPQREGGYQSPVQHITGPVTLPPLHTATVDGLKTRFPLGL